MWTRLDGHWYRVVRHDRQERLELQPEVEREASIARAARQLGWLVVTAAVLGTAWALGELALALLRALVDAGRP